MNAKNKLKLAAAFGIVVLIHFVFWSIKAHQFKSQTYDLVVKANYFFSKNSNNGDNQLVISDPAKRKSPFLVIGNITMSGFPFSHKALIEYVYLSDPLRGGVITKNVEVRSGIFSSDVEIKMPDVFLIHDEKGETKNILRLSEDTKIKLGFDKYGISNFKITGSGYKIFDKKDKLAFIVESKNSAYEFTFGKDSRYKGGNAGYRILDDENNVILSAASTDFDIILSSDNAPQIKAKILANVKDLEYFGLPENAEKEVAAANKIVNKNNFSTAATLFVTPNAFKGKVTDLLQPEQMATLSDELRPQFQKIAPAYFINTNIEKLEFSNQSYNLSMNGDAVTSTEDDLPSGLMTIKIENFDSLITDITNISKIIAAKKSVLSENGVVSFAFVDQALNWVNVMNPILKTVALKNPLSQEKISVFEVKRMKKKDFEINQTSMLDIIMMLAKQPLKELEKIKMLNADRSRDK